MIKINKTTGYLGDFVCPVSTKFNMRPLCIWYGWNRQNLSLTSKTISYWLKFVRTCGSRLNLSHFSDKFRWNHGCDWHRGLWRQYKLTKIASLHSHPMKRLLSDDVCLRSFIAHWLSGFFQSMKRKLSEDKRRINLTFWAVCYQKLSWKCAVQSILPIESSMVTKCSVGGEKRHR